MGNETINVAGPERLAEWVKREQEVQSAQRVLKEASHAQLRLGVPVVVPAGFAVEEVKRVEGPIDFKGTVVLDDVESFLAYVKRYADEAASSIYLQLAFGDAVPLKAVCIMDDHSNAGGYFAGLKVWRATLNIALQDQAASVLQACLGVKRPLELAEIIEDNEPFIVKPSAARLLEIATTLKAAMNARFVEAHNLNNGDVHIEYVTETTATAGREPGAADIPTEVVLRLALFDGQPARDLVLRFRYRVADSRLVFELSCPGFRHVVKTAVDELAAELRAGSPCPVYLGALKE